MPIDVLYVSHNCLAFTRESFTALVKNTNWDHVAALHIADDDSTDGSREWLQEAAVTVPPGVDLHFAVEPFYGPVAAMNWTLDNLSRANQCGHCHGRKPADCEHCGGDGMEEVGMFAKVDNDFIVCPKWLDQLLAVMHLNPELDILGTEPFVGDPTMPLSPREITPAKHIGGKGLLRTRSFSHCRPVASGRQGFSQWQWKHEYISKAWVTPDMPCFGIDQLPEGIGPWREYAVEYETRGWHRNWPAYHHDAHAYWQWWLDEDPARAVT